MDYYNRNRLVRIKKCTYSFDKEFVEENFKKYTARFLKHNLSETLDEDPLSIQYYDVFISFLLRIFDSKFDNLSIDKSMYDNADYEYYKKGVTAEELCTILGLKDYYDKEIVTAPQWAFDYWKFLHFLSFMAYDDEVIKSELAGAMKSFYHLLKCGACIVNYKNKNIDLILCLPIRYGDPITAMYDFHLKTNAMLFDSYIMSFIEFQEQYKCKLIDKKYILVNY